MLTASKHLSLPMSLFLYWTYKINNEGKIEINVSFRCINGSKEKTKNLRRLNIFVCFNPVKVTKNEGELFV